MIAVWVTLVASAPAAGEMSSCQAAYTKKDIDAQIGLYTLCIEGGGLKPDERARAYQDRAIAYFKKGALDLALADFGASIKADPGSSETYYNRGLVYMQRGDMQAALADFAQAARLPPVEVHAPAHVMSGRVEHSLGDVPTAMWDLAQAVQIDGRGVESRRLLAWILATTSDSTLRDGAKAVELAERAVKLDRKSWKAREALAAAYAEAGRFEDAIETQQDAIDLQSDDEGNPSAAALGRLALYRGGQPYRDTQLQLP